MTLPLDFNLAVDGEVENAYDWYEKLRPGLGDDLLQELKRVLAEIRVNPARYGYADKHRRVAMLNRFPYAVYYRVHPDRIRILAVHHTSRDPSIWKSRN